MIAVIRTSTILLYGAKDRVRERSRRPVLSCHRPGVHQEVAHVGVQSPRSVLFGGEGLRRQQMANVG